MSANALIFRVALRRLGTRWLLTQALAGVVLCTLGLLIERRANFSLATDNSLLGMTFGLCLPLLGWRLARRLLGPDFNLAAAPLARLGVNRRRVALGWALVVSALLAPAGAGLGALTVALGQYHPSSIWIDAITSAWIGALGGMAYAAYFASASLWGRRWALVALFADWLLGSGVGFLAAPWPRAHLRNLLGGEVVLGAPQALSLVTLCLLFLAYLALAQPKVAT